MDNDKQLRIGFTHFDPRFAFFWSIVTYCAKEEAERLGVKLISKPAPNVTDQIAEIQKLLEQKIDALLITPIESDHPGLINVIKRANAAGIPVVALDSGVGGGCEVMSTVRSDNIKGQEMLTEYIFERIGGKGKVVHLQGDLKVEVGAHRSEGFHNILSRYPEIELVFEGQGNWYRDRGAELTQQALAQHPDLQAVIAANDLTALGAGDAIAKAGLTNEILVAGFDALPEALLSIHEGQMTATIQQDADGMAREALQAAIQGIRGEAVPSLLLTKVELITLDNLLKTTVNGLHMLPGVLRNLEEQKLEISKANAILEQHSGRLEELVAARTKELEHANIALSRRTTLLKTSSEVSQQITGILDLKELLSEVTSIIRRQFNYPWVSIWLGNEDKNCLSLVARTKNTVDIGAAIPYVHKGVVGQACRTGETVVDNKAGKNSSFISTPGLPIVFSELAIPLKFSKTILGVLDIQSERLEAFNPDDVDALQLLSAQISVAVRNARLYAQVQSLGENSK
jgi:ribose transport system substrate-binding protein